MCFALIQPTRKETVHTPTGIDRMKKKKTLRERQELCVRAVPACSTCRGTSALILEEYCNPEFPNPPPNRSRVSTGAAIMQVMPLEGQGELTLEETILLSQNFCATYASVSDTARCPTTTVRVPTRFSSPAHCRTDSKREKKKTTSSE